MNQNKTEANKEQRPTDVASGAVLDDWWKTSKYSWAIKSVKVEKATEICVWMKRWEGSTKASKTTKHNQYEDYWPTHEEAVEHLRNRATKGIEAAEIKIKEMQAALALPHLSPNAPHKPCGTGDSQQSEASTK